MLRGVDLFARNRLTGADFRQLCAVFILIFFFAVIHIGREEAVKLRNRTVGTQHGRTRTIGCFDVSGCAFNVGSLHLARDSALPDQLVQTRLIFIEIAAHFFRMAREFRWTDRFVRFLSILGLARIVARLFRHILWTEALANRIAGRQ